MGGDMSGMLSLLLVIAVFYFLMIKPQQKQAKQRQEMLNTLKAGDKVVTIGGICGTVSRITDDKVFIEVSEGVVLEMLRNAISNIEEDLSNLKDPFAEDEDEDLTDDDDDYYYEEEDIIDTNDNKEKV